MTTFRGSSDPTKGHSGSLKWPNGHSVGPIVGAPTPPAGQLGQTNARARDTVTQRDTGRGSTRFCGTGSPLTPKGRS